MSDGANKDNSKIEYTNILNDISAEPEIDPVRNHLFIESFKKRSCV